MGRMRDPRTRSRTKSEPARFYSVDGRTKTDVQILQRRYGSRKE